MPDRVELDELVTYLTRTSRLDRPTVGRLVDDVLSFLDEAPEDFVRRRHLALQREGHGNDEIYRRIAAELRVRPFRAPGLSERQIRRVIYG